MAGTYWLTVLPETTQLEDGIKKSIDKANKSPQNKIKPKVEVDTSGVQSTWKDLGDSLRDAVQDAAEASGISLDSILQEAGQRAGEALGEVIGTGLRNTGLGDVLDGVTEKVGGLADTWHSVQDAAGSAASGVGSAVDAIGKLKSGDTSGAVQDITKSLQDLDPVARGVGIDLSGLTDKVQSAANVATTIGSVASSIKSIGSGNTSAEVDAIAKGLQDLDKAGLGTGGAADALGQIQDKTKQLTEPLGAVKETLGTVTSLFASLGTEAPAVTGALATISAAVEGLAGPLAAIGAVWWVVDEIDKHSTFDPAQQAAEARGRQQSAAAAAAPPAPGQAPAPTSDTDLIALSQLAASGDKEALGALQARAKAGDKTASDLLKTIPGHSVGGMVAGGGSGTSDSILSWLSNGEFVVNADSTAKFLPVLQAINQGMIPKFAGGGFVSAQQLDSFAQGIEGAPYRLGAVHWGDCSGAVSAVANYATGRDPFGSRFATGSEAGELAARGFKSGLGPPGSLNIGWFNGGAYGGHTAATLPNGTHFEMGGARGNGQYGGSAAGAEASEFTNHMHLPPEWFTGLDANAPTSGGAGGGADGGAGGFGSSSYTGGYSGGTGGGSFNQGAVGGGASGYRAATGAELNAAQQRMQSDQAAVAAAQKNLDAVQAGTHTQQQLNDAQQKLADAQSKAQKSAANFNQLNSGQGVGAIGGAGGAGGGNDPSQLGSILTGGLLEESGFDGSVFSNPLQWPTVKSGLAALNAFSALLPGAKNGKASGVLGGVGQSLGLGGLFDHIAGSAQAPHNAAANWQAQSGSPKLSPGVFNPSTPGTPGTPDVGSAALSAFTSATAGAGNQGGKGQGGVDNSMNVSFQGNGWDAGKIAKDIKTTQNARTRSTVVMA